MMSKKVKVAAIQIQCPDGDVKQVSIEDARELYKQLDELFGEACVPPMQPIVIERREWPRWKPLWVSGNEPIRTDSPAPQLPQVWCCADSSA